MPDSRSTLEILVDVKNAQAGARDIRQVGTAAKSTGGQAEQAGQGFGGLAKNLAVAAGGAATLRKGYDFMKGAANAAATLAKDTAALTRTTGMDAKTSSAWVSIAKNRGIETDTLTRSFTLFSRQLRAVEKGGKAATTAFSDLGISADQLKGMKTEDALMATADAFQKLPAGADKAAIAQQLFGKQSQALLPLLNMGSAGLQDQMKTMDKYGLTLDENGVKKGLELAKSQRQMKAATDGLKVSMGNALLPALVGVANALQPLVSGFSWAMQNIPGFSTAVVVLAGVLGTLAIAATIAGAFGLLAGAFGLTSAALLTLIGTALVAAAPFIAIGVAIAALVAGLVLAYKKIGWFRAGVDAAFGAIKGAVSGLGSAFASIPKAVAGAVEKVIELIKKIPDAVKGAAEEVKSAFSDVGGAVTGAPGKAVSALKSLSPFAAGGTVGAGGTLALVGERGPELMQLPGGTRITPLQQGTVTPVDVSGYGGGDIHVHVEIDKREIAHAVASQTADDRARR